MTSEKKAPVLSAQDFRLVVAVVRTHEQASRNVALLYFSVALDLRAQELSQLKMQHVLAHNGIVKDEVLLTRSTTKGGKQRLIYLTNKEIRKALNAYLKERSNGSASLLNPASPLFKSGEQRAGGHALGAGAAAPPAFEVPLP